MVVVRLLGLSISSSMMVTVTSWAVFQLSAVKVIISLETSATPGASLLGVTVTLAVGSLVSFTL